MRKTTNNEQTPADNVLGKLMAEVPKAYAARFTVIVGLTDAFCDAHLNAEYKGLCREMAVAVCQKGSPVLKGKAEGWAPGIVYALGRVNFLDDPSQTPHMTSAGIATASLSKAILRSTANSANIVSASSGCSS